MTSDIGLIKTEITSPSFGWFIAIGLFLSRENTAYTEGRNSVVSIRIYSICRLAK